MKKKLVMILTLYLSTYAMNVSADNSVGNIQTKLKFELDGEQPTIYDEDSGTNIGIDPFFEGDKEITVRMPQGWSVRLYRQSNADSNGYGTLVDMDHVCEEVILHKDYINGLPHVVKELRFKDGHRLNYSGGIYRLQLKRSLTNQELTKQKEVYENIYSATNQITTCPRIEDRVLEPIKKGEKFTFVFGDSGNWEVGTLVYKDSQTIAEENKKIEEEQRKQNEQKQEQQRRQQKLLEDNMLKHIRENDHKTWYQRLGDNIEDTWANVKGWWRG